MSAVGEEELQRWWTLFFFFFFSLRPPPPLPARYAPIDKTLSLLSGTLGRPT